MSQTIGFYMLPTGGAAGNRGRRIGEMRFGNGGEQEKFVRGIAILTQTAVRELFAEDGGSLTARQAGQLLASLKTALTSNSENTLSSALAAEVVELDQGPLEGKLDRLCELLAQASREGGLLTTLPE